MRRTLALILAGGVGSRLNVLVRHRAKPAVPFGGIYRLIDFTLSNVMNSGIERVGILTQYLPYCLTDHLGTRRELGAGRTLARGAHPAAAHRHARRPTGTAARPTRSTATSSYIARHDPEITLVLSGDHIYHMDYAALIELHIQQRRRRHHRGPPVPIEQAHLFGTVHVDAERLDHRLRGEAARSRPSNLISLGIYAFATDHPDLRALEEVCGLQGETDFGQHVFPFMLRARAARRLPLQRLLAGRRHDQGLLRLARWTCSTPTRRSICRTGTCARISTENRLGDRPPAFIAPGARVRRSTLARGCRIYGTVEEQRALARASLVEAGAIGARLDPDARHARARRRARRATSSPTSRSRSARSAHIGDPALGEAINAAYPTHLDQGMTVLGKRVERAGARADRTQRLRLPRGAARAPRDRHRRGGRHRALGGRRRGAWRVSGWFQLERLPLAVATLLFAALILFFIAPRAAAGRSSSGASPGSTRSTRRSAAPPRWAGRSSTRAGLDPMDEVATVASINILGAGRAQGGRSTRRG